MKITTKLVICLLIIITPSLIFAEGLFTTNHSKISLGDDLNPSIDQDKILRAFSVKVPSVGLVRIILNKTIKSDLTPTVTGVDGTKNDHELIKLLRGKAIMQAKEIKIAASVFKNSKGKLYLTVNFPGTSPRTGKVQLNKLKVFLNKDGVVKSRLLRVKRMLKNSHKDDAVHLDSALLNAYPVVSSLVNQADTSSTQVSSSTANSSATFRELELNIDADSDWFNEFGSSSNNEITSYLNEAETIYENDLGITFKIVRQNVYSNRSFGQITDSRGDTHYADILCNYQYYVSGFNASGSFGSNCQISSPSGPQSYYGDADSYHLFSGKNFSDNVIGLAYVGTICRAEHAAFGISQYTNSAVTPITFAHEMGHNFDADHDGQSGSTCSNASSSNFVMGAAIGGTPPDSFSNCSQNIINSYVSGSGSCLATISNNDDDNDSGEETTPEDGSDTPPSNNNPDGGSSISPPSGDLDPNLPVVSSIALNTTLRRNGLLTVTTTINSNDSLSKFAGCNLQYLFHKNRNRVYSANITTAVPFNGLSTTLSGRYNRSITANRNGNVSNSFMAARLVCNNTIVSESGTSRLRTKRLNGDRSVTINRWLRNVRNRLN